MQELTTPADAAELLSVATEMAEPEMMTVETIQRIRREHLVKGKGIRQVACELKVSRQTNVFATAGKCPEIRAKTVALPVA